MPEGLERRAHRPATCGGIAIRSGKRPCLGSEKDAIPAAAAIALWWKSPGALGDQSGSSSIELVKRLINGTPGCPRLYFGVVDVRDVADMHVRAMTHPAAKGERFIAVSGHAMSMLDIARALKARLGDAAKKGANAATA